MGRARVLVSLTILFLVADAHFAAVASASSHQSNSCMADGLKGLHDFLTAPSAIGDKSAIHAEIASTCNAIPWNRHLPAALLSKIKEWAPVKFMLHRFEQHPEAKLALLKQHLALGTAHPTDFVAATTSLLQMGEGASGDSTMVEHNGLSYRIMPFWVKGDPGSSNDICYFAHFTMYSASWLLVGAFVVRFVSDAIDRHWPVEDATLGRTAFVSQLLYAAVIVICGFAEEARSQMSERAKCSFHKRYIVNFMFLMLIGLLWRTAVPTDVEREEQHNEKMKQLAKEGKAPGDTKPAGGMGEGGVDALEGSDSEESHGAELDIQAAIDHKNRLEKTKEKEKDGKGKSGAEGEASGKPKKRDNVLQRMIRKKLAIPFLCGVGMSVLSFALMC